MRQLADLSGSALLCGAVCGREGQLAIERGAGESRNWARDLALMSGSETVRQREGYDYLLHGAPLG